MTKSQAPLMKFFSKDQSIVVAIILAAIFTLSFFNYKVALRRGRDNARENDLSDIVKILDDYKEKNSLYPPDLSKVKVPIDPLTGQGYAYLYLTDSKNFQIYASLEGGTDESVYNPVIEARGLKCGNFVCNFGKANGNVPLDKTLQEYENEVDDKKK